MYFKLSNTLASFYSYINNKINFFKKTRHLDGNISQLYLDL